MKKMFSLILAVTMVLSMAACGSTEPTQPAATQPPKETTAETQAPATEAPTESVPESVVIQSLNAEKVMADLEVPYNPQRLAVLDMAALDILNSLGVGDRIVGTARHSSVTYLSSYFDDSKYTDFGSVREPDMEALMEAEPDVIFIGNRMRSIYDDLSKIAPVIYLSVDAKTGVVNGIRQNASTVASLFGLEADVDALMADFDARIKTLNEFATGKTAIVGMTSADEFKVLGKDGRCSLISNEVGFNNIGMEGEESTATHGNEISFEYIVDKNPDYLVIMDRNAAINAEGTKPAKEMIENDLIKDTDAYKNGHIVYLANPSVWYIAEGGIEALDIMLSDLETALLP